MNGLSLWNKSFFDSLIDDVDRNLRSYHVSSYVPRADVIETESDYRLSLDLPGYEEKGLNIEIKKGVLTVSGSVEQEEEGERKERYLLKERACGTFKRSFNLPENADSSSIEAKLERGILYVTIAKRAEEKPRKINIQ